MKRKFSKPLVLAAMVAMLFSTSLTNASSIGSYAARTQEVERFDENVVIDPTTTVGILAAGVAGAYAAGRAVGEFIYNIMHSGQEVQLTMMLGGAENPQDFSKFDI